MPSASSTTLGWIVHAPNDRQLFSMARNLGTLLVGVLGILLLSLAALDWSAYSGFLTSLAWR